MSHTVPAGGVSDLSAAMGLRRLLPDCKVTPRVASLADLRDAELPCLAAMRLNYWADHLVAVLAVDAESVVLGDPLVGRVRLSHAKFEERWLGRLVTVTKSAEPRAGH
jgi:ABC-type bacteriocin/lantibiotic exporter with double-glycine peptidase domain